ncbi:MAG: thiamine phosphate synthase [Nitrospiraceae bacterium]|nr:MAG: thiamine phosphate synthase [Nitrospiraceae bacterium]
MIDFRLYLITDRKLTADRYSLTASVEKALKGGVRAIQLREKDLGTRELLTLAHKMRKLTEKYNARLFINDRFDIALAAGADGVQLTQNSIPADAVRRVVKDKLMIGVSTHSLKEAKEAEKARADFITLGPVYRTPSKLKYGKPVGIDILKTVCGKVNIPVFAIGGIKNNKIKEAKEAGAYGIAMISEIFGAEDIREKARETVKGEFLKR